MRVQILNDLDQVVTYEDVELESVAVTYSHESNCFFIQFIDFETDNRVQVVIHKNLLPDQARMNWIDVKSELPAEGGRYWCYVEELNDLGIGHYQQNISYHEIEKRWGTENGDQVTHWMPLADNPNQ